jgi:hypothetical protein
MELFLLWTSIGYMHAAGGPSGAGYWSLDGCLGGLVVGVVAVPQLTIAATPIDTCVRAVTPITPKNHSQESPPRTHLNPPLGPVNSPAGLPHQAAKVGSLASSANLPMAAILIPIHTLPLFVCL